MVGWKSQWEYSGVIQMTREKKLAYETYTLILKHSIWDGEQEHELEEPLCVKHIAELTLGNPTYLINEMMDRMKCELLKRVAR